jgi:hypothetical protein
VIELISLGTIALWASIATIEVVRRDGYRRLPELPR